MKQFRKGDKVYWDVHPEYGVGQVQGPYRNLKPVGSYVRVRFEGYPYYGGLPEWVHTPRASELRLVGEDRVEVNEEEVTYYTGKEILSRVVQNGGKCVTKEEAATIRDQVRRSRESKTADVNPSHYGSPGDNRVKSGTEFRYKVASVLQEIQDLLVEKNEAYGNSALDPINVFSKASSTEQLRVRIDDKINRLYHGKEYGQEDTVTDLIGYLVLLKIAEKEQGES